MYLIVGLGNPGAKYENTRHNVGFAALDFLSRETGIPIRKIKFKGLLGDGMIGGEKVVLLKPQTFMNLSGESVLAASEFYKIPAENIVVVSDDATLSEGALRIRRKGSDGGHNGLKSIIYLLQSDEFIRIKIGVGKKPPRFDLADFVLGTFSEEQGVLVTGAVKSAARAAVEIVENSVDAAMNKFNTNGKKDAGAKPDAKEEN